MIPTHKGKEVTTTPYSPEDGFKTASTRGQSVEVAAGQTPCLTHHPTNNWGNGSTRFQPHTQTLGTPNFY